MCVRVYQISRGNNDFVLRDQMQRSARSIASNIAEGSERGGKDFIRFLKIARGSAAELRTQVYIASKVGFVRIEEMTQLVQELKEISEMLTGLAKSVKNRLTERKPTAES